MKKDVIQRILKVIRNKRMRDEMIRKVQNDEDLSLQESYLLYKDVEFGDELDMTKKRKVDIDWTDHAEYRGELRGVDPNKMNLDVKDKLKDRFMKKKTRGRNQRFKTQEGTAVLDYDVSRNPADADIITTWKNASDAIQYLADLTGKRIIIANDSLSIYDKKASSLVMKVANEDLKRKIKSILPKLAEAAQKEYDEWDEENIDEYAGGGICHFIADRICDVLYDMDIECATLSLTHKQHVIAIAYDTETKTAIMIDLPESTYETGGGFSWKKIPDVEIDPRDFDLIELNWDDYFDEDDELYEI
jgi:small nuclear ribonucleoprotein (snRNP)-like protein